MEIQMWKELLDPYEQAVSELLVKFRNLKEEHRKKNLYSPIESVCGRVKSVASILDKMQRKNISFEDMEEEVEDIAGVRIICQFVEDIETVANLIYKRTDMEVRSKKDYLTNKKASGYRSFHLIVWYTVQTVSGPKRLQVEIQIRTMAMNFWATTEHSLQYKYRGQIPEHVAERLAASADAIVALDEGMSLVRDEIMDAQRFRQTEVELVQSILTSIENLYRVESEREVRKIQDEFYRIYSLHNIDELDRFAKQLDILAEGAGAQSVDSSIRS
ncbi:MAG: GTP pyrophosphokinase family protein [Eubacteriales bacterium]|jgi:putative GTP pyrophosphokinase|nr:GTP pyrophosphokinase family protein [Lachnospiraceae bacterium]MDD5859001.1 GTP pyrophosphokinase family protein [Eubacteriales bacterium]MCH4064545.1 GTP pyrophosphokinase family protein [Lachnospiraceae bacterium]MCH4104776.1 GTP pyrophosphokinase family protein [Lachnospiraceae bacterium]MCI1308581.1 GTP pyrophosphokinase family protein [Lachnospiraceae bacterium]